MSSEPMARYARGGVKALLPVAFVMAVAVVWAPACSLGQGTGCVAGTLDVPECWSGSFDLHPDFFAAVPTNSAALEIRVQNGGDYETFSDGLLILVDDLHVVRGDPLADGGTRPSYLNQPLIVSLPPSVVPPGVPVTAVADPSIVHANLYLERTCRTQNVALYALDAVTLQADGTCNRPATGEPASTCPGPAVLGATSSSDAGADAATTDASASIEAGATDAASTGADATIAPSGDAGQLVCGQSNPVWPNNIATSTITFSSLFDGNTAESNDQQRLTEASFDLYLADPRDVCSGGIGPPPRCQAHLQGNFSFYFQSGRPAQPFP
jgi:hypothetical protein